MSKGSFTLKRKTSDRAKLKMEDVVGFEVKISREATTIEAQTVLNMESV